MIDQTLLYKEIHEQPSVLEKVVRESRTPLEELAKAIKSRGISHVVIAARGTSDNAGRYAQYLLGSVNRLPVGLATPSLFSIYQRPPLFGNALVLGISQSGKSPDIVSVLTEARSQGALTAALTNIPNSLLAENADFVVPLQAGEEKSVAATKTYTSELAAIGLLSGLLAEDAAMQTELARLPEMVEEVLKQNKNIERAAQRYRYMQHCVVIGRGYNYASAFELALKLKELTYIIVEPYSSADFLHGPLAVIDEGFPVVVIAPSGEMLVEMKEFQGKLSQRGAEIIAISDELDFLAQAHTPLQIPQSVPEMFSPITAIVPGQLFAMHLASARGFDPDRPRGLRKVTETR
jgi:glucosamine--fructose-6-phosphate aminotransferase (isomerizing)